MGLFKKRVSPEELGVISFKFSMTCAVSLSEDQEFISQHYLTKDDSLHVILESGLFFNFAGVDFISNLPWQHEQKKRFLLSVINEFKKMCVKFLELSEEDAKDIENIAIERIYEYMEIASDTSYENWLIPFARISLENVIGKECNDAFQCLEFATRYSCAFTTLSRIFKDYKVIF
jgi:hypothetical protein